MSILMPIVSLEEGAKENKPKPKPRPKTANAEKIHKIKIKKEDEADESYTPYTNKKKKAPAKPRAKKVAAGPLLNIDELKDKLKEILNKEDTDNKDELRKLLDQYGKGEGGVHTKKRKTTNNGIKQEELDLKQEFILDLEEEDTRTFACPICKDETLRTVKDLKEHYKEDHKGKRLRTSRYSLDTFPCDICGKEFKSTGGLKDHIDTHNTYYHCDHCNASHKKLLDHILHLRSHCSEDVFKCIICDFTTEDIIKMTEHVNFKHLETEDNQYWCEPCKKGFQIKSWFEEHDNFHTGLKPFDCDLCCKSFMYSRYLKAHKNNMHKDENFTGPQIHACVICKKEYQHRNSLRLHMNSHTGNYSICDICGKILSSKEKLKFHIRTHTGYKPYTCTYCGKSFTKKPILVEHVRIHTGERPYHCEFCNKSFSQRTSLVIHIRSHTGERPYPCELCNKGFVARAMLNLHLKSCRGLMSNDYE